MSQSHSSDSSEQAVERENDEVGQLSDDTEQELLQVKHALQWAKEGGYFTCEKCGGEISVERLKALPSTTLCIACAK